MTTGKSNYEDAGYVDRPDELRSMPGRSTVPSSTGWAGASMPWPTRGTSSPFASGSMAAPRHSMNAEVYFKRASRALGL